MRATDDLGRYGEDLACRHLSAAGFTLLERNWRCARGEIDAVALDADGTLVFVEVKTRSSGAFGSPAEAVTIAKARRLRGLALSWLAAHPQPARRGLRFDVVCVVRSRGSAPVVHHLRGAF